MRRTRQTSLPAAAVPIADPTTGVIDQSWHELLIWMQKTLAASTVLNNGVTWTSGINAPTALQPIGSIYSRVKSPSVAGETLYINHGVDVNGGAIWNAVSG